MQSTRRQPRMRAAGALLIKLTAGLLLPLCLGLHPSEVPDVDCPATRHASSSVEAELDEGRLSFCTNARPGMGFST